MKYLAIPLYFVTAYFASSQAYAREVTLTTLLKGYGGNGAYLALYLTSGCGTDTAKPIRNHNRLLH